MNFKRLSDFFKSLPQYTQIPGAEISVFVAHKEVYHEVVGVADITSGKPLEGGELYYFYSATKPLTCTAVMQLVERGVLGLNDPVSLYLPEYAHVQVKEPDGTCRPPKRPITISHLLSMTAGVDYNFNTEAVRRVKEETNGRLPTREVVRALAESPLSFDPGEKWQYSACHDILAAVIEEVSGMRYSEFIRQNIFEPLGMENSYFHSTPEVLARMTTPYYFENGKTFVGKKANALELGTEYESGGASLISCVSDYVRFTDAMANGGVGANGVRIIQANTIDLMRENRVGNRMETDCEWAQLAGYGYGFGVRTLISRGAGGSLGSIGEFGWDGAKGVYLLIDPARQVSLVYAEHRGSHKEVLHPRLRNLLYASLNAED